MAAHHEPFKALGPIDWSDVAHDDLKHFLTTTFSSAQTLIDSLPLPPSTSKSSSSQQTGRARSHTESAVPFGDVRANRALSGREHANSSTSSAAVAAQLRKEWKEVKTNPNPLDISVYKLSGKDSKGAWFARRSVHEGVSFDKFKLALEREFAETLKIGGGKAPATGNIRGIGAEKKVEHAVCDGVGMVEVYLLSAQFPGPTTPRDFVTLFLSSASADETVEERKGKGKAPRQFMVVSKPCVHPECMPRSGFIRGQYESVEIIREIPVDKPLRRVRSSIDISREEIRAGQNGGDTRVGKEAMMRSARQATLMANDNHSRSHSLAQSMNLPPREAENDTADTEMAIEWLMVTRSDPGGSVPRFMVEKGTPNGIITDADKLLKWMASKAASEFEDTNYNNFKEEAMMSEEAQESTTTVKPQPSANIIAPRSHKREVSSKSEPAPAPSGFYNMMAGAFGAASSVVASRLPVSFVAGSAIGTDTDYDGSDSITSSEASFASAQEPAASPLAEKRSEDLSTLEDGTEAASTHSAKSNESNRPASLTTSQHEKQLKKLQDRRKKLDEKLSKQQEKNKTRQNDDSASALARLKEKHEKEIQKQEEAYQREIKKLEEKRVREEKKAEERRKKEMQKEERNNMALELERVKVERDMARKEMEILKDQVGELQSQNTQLVAQLGRMGALGKVEMQKAETNESSKS